MKRPGGTLRTITQLRVAGFADATNASALHAVASRYAVAITPDMVRLIDRADADDPIARQFVPDARELQQRPEERADPLERGAPVARCPASCTAIPTACC